MINSNDQDNSPFLAKSITFKNNDNNNNFNNQRTGSGNSQNNVINSATQSPFSMPINYGNSGSPLINQSANKNDGPALFDVNHY